MGQILSMSKVLSKRWTLISLGLAVVVSMNAPHAFAKTPLSEDYRKQKSAIASGSLSSFKKQASAGVIERSNKYVEDYKKRFPQPEPIKFKVLSPKAAAERKKMNQVLQERAIKIINLSNYGRNPEKAKAWLREQGLLTDKGDKGDKSTAPPEKAKIGYSNEGGRFQGSGGLGRQEFNLDGGSAPAEIEFSGPKESKKKR